MKWDHICKILSATILSYRNLLFLLIITTISRRLFGPVHSTHVKQWVCHWISLLSHENGFLQFSSLRWLKCKESFRKDLSSTIFRNATLKEILFHPRLNYSVAISTGSLFTSIGWQSICLLKSSRLSKKMMQGLTYTLRHKNSKQ